MKPLVDPEQFTRRTMVLPCHDPETDLRAEDLIIHKAVAGRPRALEDVRSVLLKNPHLDRGIILRWLRELGATMEQPLVDRFEEVAKEG